MSTKIQPTVFLFLCVPLAALLLLPASLYADPPGSLADRVSELEYEVAELKALLVGVSRQEVYGGEVQDREVYYDTLVLSGMNVQIDNGTGDILTLGGSTPNGLGNLIIGYNTLRLECETRTCETRAPFGNVRSGSHMLVLGDANNYISYGGIIAGQANYTSGPYASVSGGVGNAAKGRWATVGGGGFNQAYGEQSSVSGGSGNWATGDYSSVSGGQGNYASGAHSTVSGGGDNFATSQYSSISGGHNNHASAQYSSASGGYFNFASGPFASVSGGFWNQATGMSEVVVGGDEVECNDGSDSEYESKVCGEGGFDPAD